MIRRWSGLVSMALLLPCGAAGQSMRVGSLVQTYTFADAEALGIDQAQLVAIPIATGWKVHPVGLRLDGGYARGIVTFADGTAAEIEGWTDTRLTAEASWRMFTARAFARIPTGDSRYGPSDLPVVGLFGSDLLPFALHTWGSGGAFGGEVEVTATRGRYAVGISGGYMMAREHPPFESTGVSYRPSPEVRIKGTVATRLGAASSVSMIAGYQGFAAEAVAGREIFEPGARWEAQVALAHPLGARESVLVYTGLYSRSEGRLTVLGTSSQGLLPGLLGSAARRVFAVGMEAQATRGAFVLLPEAHLRALTSNGGAGRGWLMTVGAGADWRVAGGAFARRIVVTPGARLHVGSAEGEGVPTSVSGWEVDLAVRWERGG